MTRPARWLPAVLVLVLAGCSGSRPETGGTPGDGGAVVNEIPPLRMVLPPGNLALVHAAVLEPATGELRTGQTVLVSTDRIVAVGPDGTVLPPAGTPDAGTPEPK